MASSFRVGQGYDAHRLSPGRALVLGGVEIPHEQGLLGHSDADVLCHAIIDALLGAAGLGDIGQHFPDTAAYYKDVSSLRLLAAAAEKTAEVGGRVVNIDATVVAQQPKLAPYRAEMAARIAAALGLDAAAVNIKATTEEGMGFTGRGEGVAAYAVCLLEII